MQRLLITGASGLIGTHLMDAAHAQGYAVRGLDVQPAKVARLQRDIEVVSMLDSQALHEGVQRFAPTHVVHLAARTDLLGRHLRDYDANITGVRNVVLAIAGAPSVQRTIYASTQLVCRRGYVPQSDTDYAPGNLYGESKVHTERIVRKEAPGEWCLVRPTTIWGPWMSPHYQRFLRMLRRGLYVHIGDAPLLKSYGFIGNTVHQLLRLLTAPAASIQGRTFYLADYEPLSLQRWVDALAAAVGGPRVRRVPSWAARSAARLGDVIARVGWRSFPFTSFRLDNVMMDNVFDMSALAAVVPELPYSMDDGVRATAEWFLREVER